MSTTVESKNPGASSAALGGLEAKLGHPLPEDYRSFLLKHNGGEPTPDCFRYGTGAYTDSSVRAFLGFGDKYYDIENTLDAYSGRLPPATLPIGEDEGGNLVLLGLGPNAGKVYFWDHEEETHPPGWANVHLIADTFTAFLDGLFEDE